MNINDTASSRVTEVEEEIAGLRGALRAAEVELTMLIGGQPDAAGALRGPPHVLPDAGRPGRASEEMQRHGADTQAAILNALPAHVALIDHDGVIVAVNDSWRRVTTNVLQGPDVGVGQNYIDVCERARGGCSHEAQAAAVGIRRVLQGAANDFAIEYPCPSPAQQRWFLLTVTPVREDRGLGAVVMHVNMTERRRADAAAEESQKRLRDLIDGLGPSIFVGLMTPDGILIEANRPALAAGGLRPEDVLGKPFDETYWWTYSRDVQRQLREAIQRGARGQRSRFDVQVRTAADRLIDVDFSLQPVQDEAGEVVFLVPSASVITERKQTENALRESDEKFRYLADNITDAFWIRSPDMRQLHYVSPAFERIWGRPAESLHANPHAWIDFTLPEDLERVLDVFAALMADAPSVDTEYRIVRPDGELRWVRVRGFQVRDGAGTLIRLTGIVTDTTELKRAAEELRMSTEQFRTLAEAMPQIVFMARPDGWCVYLNQRWADYTGLADAESFGFEWNKSFHPDDQQRSWEAWQQATATISTYSIEIRLRRADGLYRWWLVRGVPMRDAAGTVVTWCGTCTDIHDLKMAELEISRANLALQAEIVERTRAEDAADAANRAKSQFLANMSHEIRTPLNGVVGMTELILGTDLSAEQREYLDIVKASGESLLTVINDILDFSKIEAGKLTLDLVPFDLNECLATTLKLLASRAHLKGLELACDIGSDVPSALVGDPGRLGQIITNLMGNAIKFTERGEVVLTVQAETRSDRSASLRFSVSDTGIGVPQAQHEAIFKPFTQADGSTTRKYGGTGLGLAISTSLVELLGGRIWLESESGKGSTFHFTASFEVQPPTAFAPPTIAREAQMTRLRDMPVLVVDDNAVNRRILEATLQRWLMKPVLTHGGQAGLAAMRERARAGTAFPVVLLDGHMPEMDGFSVVEEIRRDPHLAATTVLMLTSARRQGDGARSRALGIAAYLMKPVSQAELLEAILSALGMPSDPAARLDVISQPSREGRKPLRILLAEDNKINQLVAERLLGKRGHAVVIAGTGREALAALDAADSGGFDLILMDVQMPDMDGFEATAVIRLREKALGTHLPIIAMTAHAMKGDQERCLAAGMDGYVAKPIHAAQLFATIDSLFP